MRFILIVLYLLGFFPQSATGGESDGTGSGRPASFAVVIGNNEGEDLGPATLRYADDDAIAMHELLSEAGVQSRLLVSPDAETVELRRFQNGIRPTLAAVLRTVEELYAEILAAKKIGKKTELTLFYSGHGDIDDGEGFVVLDGGRLTRSLLLNKIIAASPADTNHVIIDACKSYFMVFDKGPGGERRPFNGSFGVLTTGTNLDRTGFVLSASSGEDSHEWERYQAGIFSYEVRSALRGGADANLDGRITYGELGAFVATANRGIANERFRPEFLVSPPGRVPGKLTEAVLVWNDSAGCMTVDGDAAGHYYIETEFGIRIADVHSNRADPLSVHLPPERPLFVRRADDFAEGVLTTDEAVYLSSLSMRPTTMLRKGALSVAFESLFSTPFSVDAVKRYDALFEKKAESAKAQADRPSRSKPIEYALLGVAVSSLTVGGTMSIFALDTRNNAKDAAQVDVPAMNQKIDRYNTAAIALYSVGAAAGISWLVMKLLSHKKHRSTLTVFPIISPAELSIGLGSTWRK